MKALDRIHGEYVFNRRVRVLAERLADLLPFGARVLDVGCGDGLLDSLIMHRRPDLTIHGIDVFRRPQTHIPVECFDGTTIPHADGTFEVVLFVDVLHHTDDPTVLLAEAARVARRFVVLKDHTRDGLLADATLRFMDWVGNARHGVVLPYNYLSRLEWLAAFSKFDLSVETWNGTLGLYPWFANVFFGRSLHFVARLATARKPAVHAAVPARPEPAVVAFPGAAR
jgi:SAM-dependent methyltransferase